MLSRRQNFYSSVAQRNLYRLPNRHCRRNSMKISPFFRIELIFSGKRAEKNAKKSQLGELSRNVLSVKPIGTKIFHIKNTFLKFFSLFFRRVNTMYKKEKKIVSKTHFYVKFVVHRFVGSASCRRSAVQKKCLPLSVSQLHF